MPNPLNITDAADLTDVAIRDIWIKGSDKESRMFEQLFNVETGVTDYNLRESSMSGLGYAGRVVENAAVTAQSPVQGFDRLYTQVQYGIVQSFTKPMWSKGHSWWVTIKNKCCKLRENLKNEIIRSEANIYA